MTAFRKNPFSQLALLAGVLLLSGVPPAAAETEDLTLIPLEQLLQTDFVSASKMARQISDAPSAVVIVTADDIKAYGYHSLADVINSMRGLYTTYDRAYQYMGGRGFGAPGDFAGRVMLMIDGFAAADNIYSQAYIDNSGLIDLEIVERVEYVPGTGAVTYGNNAFLGIINVVTKKGSSFGGMQISGDAISYGGKKARATFGKQLENGANVLVSLSRLDSDGQTLFFPGFDDQANPDPVRATDGIVRNMDYEYATRVFGKVEYENLSVEGAYSDRKKGKPNGAYGVVFNDFNQNWDTEGYVSARYDTDLNLKLKSSTHAYYGIYIDRGAGQNPTEFWQERNRGQWVGIDQKFVANGFDHHVLMFGAELRYDFQLDFSDPAGTSAQKRTISSLYAQDEITLNDKWKTNIGARFDYGSDVGGNISPRLALMFTPTLQTTLKAAYSSAFRMPTAYEKYYTDGEQIPNPGLMSEYVTSTELVLQHDFSPKIQLTGTIYHYRQADVITYDDASGQNINGGNSETNGAEIQLDRIWDGGIRFRGSASWQKAEDTEGHWLMNSPKVLGKANLTFPMLENALRTGVEVQYMGPRLTGEQRETGSVTLANLTFSTERNWHGLSASLSIRNLFDNKYDAVAPFTQVSTTTGYVQDTLKMDGRNFWLQVNYDFLK